MSLYSDVVQPTGLEPVTSSFAGRRSNPTELRLHKSIAKCESLSASGHSIEIKSLLIDHRFRNVIFLLSLEEKSTFIDDTHIDETFYLLSREFLFRERLFILQVSDTPLIAHIRTELLIFIPSKNCHRLLFPFCETTSCGLFFYDRCFESVTICHEKNWSGGPGSNRHTQGLKP